ncbi:MAG: sugar ABC transporter substrate-binding protein [Treponema sp.]|jgi:multiple sugar transport system substrate-binding protein|nr:sugar ABC transporter substrate-binding protein [Treponema sp.]
MRKIAVLGVVLILAGVFAFAGGGRQSSGTAGGRVQITYSNWGTPDEARIVQAVADRYNNLQDKVHVTVVAIPHDTYEATLNTRATAGQLPDCGIMSEAATLQYATSGLLADISGMYGAGESKPLDSLAFRSPDGKVVAYSVANEILLLYYNKDMFDKAGVPYPPSAADRAWTWDEFVAAAKKLTFDVNGRTPDEAGFNRNQIRQYGAMVETLTWQLEVWALSNGGGFYSPDGRQVTVDQDAAIEAIQKVADLHLKDNVAPLSPGLTDDGIQRSIIAGTVAMATGGQWNVGTCLATARDTEGLNYGVAVLPKMKQLVTINTGGPNVVFSQSKNQREAMDFLKWYAQEENAWSLIESGIWMPTLQKWYTDESFTRRWAGNPNFPPYTEYKSAVVDFASNYARPTSWYYTNNTIDFNNLLQSALGEVWTGARTAREAITANAAALRRAHQGN